MEAIKLKLKFHCTILYTALSVVTVGAVSKSRDNSYGLTLLVMCCSEHNVCDKANDSRYQARDAKLQYCGELSLWNEPFIIPTNSKVQVYEEDGKSSGQTGPDGCIVIMIDSGECDAA